MEWGCGPSNRVDLYPFRILDKRPIYIRTTDWPVVAYNRGFTLIPEKLLTKILLFYFLKINSRIK